MTYTNCKNQSSQTRDWNQSRQKIKLYNNCRNFLTNCWKDFDCNCGNKRMKLKFWIVKTSIFSLTFETFKVPRHIPHIMFVVIFTFYDFSHRIKRARNVIKCFPPNWTRYSKLIFNSEVFSLFATLFSFTCGMSPKLEKLNAKL